MGVPNHRRNLHAQILEYNIYSHKLFVQSATMMSMMQQPETNDLVKCLSDHRKDNYVSRDKMNGLDSVSPSGSKVVDRIVALPDANGVLNGDTKSNHYLSMEEMLDLPSLTSCHCDSQSLMYWDHSTHNASFSSHKSSSVHHHDRHPIQSAYPAGNRCNDVADVPRRDSSLVSWNLHPNETLTFATAKSRLTLVESKNYLRGDTAGRSLDELSPVLTLRKKPHSRNAMCAEESTEREPSLHMHILRDRSDDYSKDGDDFGSLGLDDTMKGEKSMIDALPDNKGGEDQLKRHVRTNFSTPSRANSNERFTPNRSQLVDSTANKQDVVPSPPRRQDSLQNIEDHP
jgi:hypothetical protein